MSKVTKEAINAKITDVAYIHLPNSTVTICSITLANGYDFSTVESFCLSSGCTGTFDWDIPSGAWATSVDWQPLH